MAVDDVMRVLGVLAAAFPANKVGKETLEVYKLTLADIPADVLEQATLHVITRSRFFPTVSEIRDAANAIMVGLHNVPSAFEAWGEVCNVIARCGQYYRYQISGELPEYSHPLIERAVEIMGYRNLCESENSMADRAHFFRVYEGLLERAEEELRMLPSVRQFSDQYQLMGDRLALTAKKMRLGAPKQESNSEA